MISKIKNFVLKVLVAPENLIIELFIKIKQIKTVALFSTVTYNATLNLNRMCMTYVKLEKRQRKF